MDAARKRRLRTVLLIALALGAGGFLLVFVWRPGCPILGLTGLYCPGCGGQRMLRSLVHGDAVGAFGYNPYLMIAGPLLALYVLAEAVLYVRGRPALGRRRWVQLLLGALVLAAMLFMVLRNLPAFRWMAPD